MRKQVRRRHGAHFHAQSVCAEHRELFDGTPGGQRARAAAKAIVRVGRVVNLAVPIMDTLQLPGAMGDDELLAYGRELLKRVSPHADAFVTEGLPPGVLQQLGDGITALEAAREARSTSRRRFSAVFESIRETLDYADKTVDVLEVILLNTPAAPPKVLAKLSIARRVGPRASAPEPTAPEVTPADKAA